MSSKLELEQQLNSSTKESRLSALKKLMSLYNSGEIPKPQKSIYVNNHIHTTYSFSPYSPTSAAYTAWVNGLQTAGIMDHDSVSGVTEFLKAGEILGLSVTSGFEMRADMSTTPFDGKRINNPDQNSVAYLLAQGIPNQNIDKADAWLSPFRQKREERNEKMTVKINNLLKNTSVSLDYKKDVRPISLAAEGGSVTERHILFALAKKITLYYGAGEGTLKFLKDTFDIVPSGSLLDILKNKDSNYYDYYLLGLLKSSLVEQFYINATDECPNVLDFVSFVKSIGGIPAYSYLGDVGESPTGDKKAQVFEDDYLDELIAWVKEAGFLAISYAPSRNTTAQAHRVAALAKKYNFFQISGEDINTPFQSFICKDLEKDEFAHLIPATWALIGHERSASKDTRNGMFSDKTINELPTLEERIEYFADIGKHERKEGVI